MEKQLILQRIRSDAHDTALLEKAKEYALSYIHGADARRVYPDAAALSGLSHFFENMPDEPASAHDVLDMLHRYGSPATVAQTGGRYFGFVNGGILPAARAARWLADVWDQNAVLYVASPVASALEEVCEGWMVDLLGLPEGTAAGFVTGTSVATLCGLAAGRNELLKRAGWDIVQNGLNGAPRLRVVLSAGAHSTVYKALSLLGFGKKDIETVPMDAMGCMQADALPDIDSMTLLILQAGNVNTGGFDPFRSLCTRARNAGAWVHVDGAFGLWAAASPAYRHLTDGVDLADSWSVDAHKTLNAPYDCGVILCRHRSALVDALHMTGAYIVQSSQRDSMMYTPEMSRRARGVDLWASLKSLGKKGIAAMIEELCKNARLFGELFRQEGFTVLNDICFNQVLVSCNDAERTRKLLAAVQQGGECWCGGSVWDGEPVIRVSVCSFRTTKEDVRRSVQAFCKAAKEIE